jgi:protein O-mannosyl-transferase
MKTNIWKSPASGAALIVLLTVIAYLPALRGSFLWDDDDYITRNRTLRSSEGLRQIWFSPEVTVQYYPLTFTGFWLEYQLWGLRTTGYHVVNVLLHAANALLFWRLLSKLKVRGSWWAAAAFALHPVHVMSVAWITELKNVLSGFWFLLALLAYLRYSSAAEPTARKRHYAAALALYACALFSKTSTSILPVAILLIIWWKEGRVEKRQWLALAPFFCLGVGLGTMTLWLERYTKGATGAEFVLPFLERFLVAGRSFWFCLSKLFWPVPLIFIYPKWPISAASLWSYYYSLGAIASLAMLWWARRWIGRAPFAVLVYFALAFPALVLLQMLYMMRYSFVADHWQYLGSLGVLALVSAGATAAFERFGALWRRSGACLGAVTLTALGILTWRQAFIYRDAQTLWRDTIAMNPNAWIAHNNLGLKHWESGRPDEAVGEWKAALHIKPDYAEAYNNLGTGWWQLGKREAAIDAWQNALRIDPGFVRALNNLGLAAAQTGRLTEAIRYFEEALRLKPNYAEAHYSLGLIFEQTGRPQEAIQHYERILHLNPDSPGLKDQVERLRSSP